jgi:serine/threonine protein kinase
VPLKYPAEWKYEGFPYEIPDEAHRAFFKLISLMAEGANYPGEIYEDFKTGFGDNTKSSDASWAESDMSKAMRLARENAARYVAAFYAGMEYVAKRKIEVPPVRKLNQILAENGIPLLIDPPNLILKEGDIEFVPENASAEVQSTAFIRGKEIGRGSFGAVYKVTRRTKIGEYHFAMKVLEPSSFIKDKERANKRFIREMKALRKLQHRGIVPLLEAGIDAAQNPYILMPLIEGENIRDALSGADPIDVYMAFEEILLALDFAHGKKAIHRDLKPKNILIRNTDGQPQLLDFGCAYLIDEIDENMTTSVVGTPGYIPREVHDDPKHKDKRQDIYACGVMLYEVIMSRRPNIDRYEPVEKVFPQFKGVDNVIREALAPEDERIESADIMRDMIHDII